MKIRAGFVSNSSSSSFVVVGKVVDFDEFKEKYNLAFENVDFEKIKRYERNNEFIDYLDRNLFDAGCLACLYGNIGDHDRVLLYNRVPEKPEDAIEVIKRTRDLLGEVRVNSVTNSTEDGIFYGD